MIIYNGREVHTYTIPGQPIPWARPRISGRTFFDSQRPIKNIWAISLQYQREGQPFYEKTPLELVCHFYFSIPASYNPKRRKELDGEPYLYKGDLDNCVKFIGDNCNAILFDDDCTIFKINATKTYSLNPRTEFALIPHKPTKPTRKTEKKLAKSNAFKLNLKEFDAHDE
jgi:Holliday junction resolvase RusA-like endonuclease